MSATCEHCKCSPVASNNTRYCGSWECRIKGRIIVAENGCWLWTGCVSKRTGYGKFQDRNKTITAHVASYRTFVGDIPEGMFVLHAPHDVCGNRHCVNPEHLRVGTASDNQMDRKRDGTACTGRAQKNAYPIEFVNYVTERLVHRYTKKDIALIYGISESTIRAWVRGKSRRGNAIA